MGQKDLTFSCGRGKIPPYNCKAFTCFCVIFCNKSKRLVITDAKGSHIICLLDADNIHLSQN